MSAKQPAARVDPNLSDAHLMSLCGPIFKLLVEFQEHGVHDAEALAAMLFAVGMTLAQYGNRIADDPEEIVLAAGPMMAGYHSRLAALAAESRQPRH